VSSSGSWAPPAHGEDAPVRRGVLSLRLEPSSAALVTVVPAKKKPHRTHRNAERPARLGRAKA
jgi:hypothetical protein